MIWGRADVVIIEIKCTINVMHLNNNKIIHRSLAHGKFVFPETGPWCQKSLETAVPFPLVSFSSGYLEGLAEKAMAPHSSTLAWKIPWTEEPGGLRRSLVGCSPWGRWGSDTTEGLHLHFSLSCIGEGNGNPLQCSYLENPRDGGAWWAAVYGVAQSRTRLKQLSRCHLEQICRLTLRTTNYSEIFSRNTCTVGKGGHTTPTNTVEVTNVLEKEESVLD